MPENILVYCEQRDGKLQNVSFELLGAARKIAEKCGEKVVAVLLGKDIGKEAEKLFHYGADEVYTADDERLEKYMTEQYAQAFTAAIEEVKPNIVLIGATSIGRDLAPRMSARLRTGLTADCTGLEADESGNLFMTRPAFGGNLFATIVCPDARPQMSTVRPGVMKKPAEDKSRTGTVKNLHVDWHEEKFVVKLIEEVKETKEVEKIEEAKILVSCGRGFAEKICMAEELAHELKGTVSSSRALVDAGRMPQPRQVGQTGKTVRPQCYMAIGISGAVQHLAGMEESEFIIAVNKDKNAPIMSVAHLGVVGDAGIIIPKVIEEIRRHKKA